MITIVTDGTILDKMHNMCYIIVIYKVVDFALAPIYAKCSLT